MKDLYSSLGIDPGASDEEVVAALEGRPDLAAHAAVLRADDRRATYDRTYAALKAIGALRHRLGLDSESSWFLENSPDFAPALRGGLRSTPSAGPSAGKPLQSPGAAAGGTRRAGAAPADPARSMHSPRPAIRIRPSLVVALIAGGALAVAVIKIL